MKVTQNEFRFFQHQYFRSQIAVHERVGQAFCNKYNITDTALFYETDTGDALKYIADKYVEPF